MIVVFFFSDYLFTLLRGCDDWALLSYSQKCYKIYIRYIIKALLQAYLLETEEMEHTWKGHPFQNAKICYFLLCVLQYHLKAVGFFWQGILFILDTILCSYIKMFMCTYLSLNNAYLYICVSGLFVSVYMDASTVIDPTVDSLLSKKNRSIKGERKEVLHPECDDHSQIVSDFGAPVGCRLRSNSQSSGLSRSSLVFPKLCFTYLEVFLVMYVTKYYMVVSGGLSYTCVFGTAFLNICTSLILESNFHCSLLLTKSISISKWKVPRYALALFGSQRLFKLLIFIYIYIYALMCVRPLSLWNLLFTTQSSFNLSVRKYL